MIENPKVGQRVWLLLTKDCLKPVVVKDADSEWTKVVYDDLVERHAKHVSVPRGMLYDSPASAAAALRAEAQRLLGAAEKLESEVSE